MIPKYLLKITILSIVSVLMIAHLHGIGRLNSLNQTGLTDAAFRENFYSDEMLANRDQLSEDCRSLLSHVENDVIYYPIPESSVDKSLTTSFVDTWMDERSYKGNSFHEGTDIMASKDKSGLFPVVSMTDGVITNLGWLEKGGYRVGITSESGIYYYYAHLESYAAITQGDHVLAGELLGYMGDSGYGEEGTTGQFPVHLHLGIYMYRDDMEISFNPYYVLCSLENNKLKYAYF